MWQVKCAVDSASCLRGDAGEQSKAAERALCLLLDAGFLLPSQSSGSSGADYGRRCAEQLDEDGDHAAHTRQHCTSAHTHAYMNANRPTHLPTYLYPPTCLPIPTHLPTHLPVHGIGTKPLTDLLFVADVALQACVAATLINGAQRRHATVITCEHPPATDTGSILDAQPLLRPRSAVIGPELSDDVHSKQRSGGRRLITLCLVTAMVTPPPDLPRAFGFLA